MSGPIHVMTLIYECLIEILYQSLSVDDQNISWQERMVKKSIR